MINNIIQINSPYLTSIKHTIPKKSTFESREKAKLKGLYCTSPVGFITCICMYAYLSLMQKAHPNLTWLPWSLHSLRYVGEQEASLPQAPAQTVWHGMSKATVRLYGHNPDIACLQGPEEPGFTCCSVKHGRAGDRLLSGI